MIGLILVTMLGALAPITMLVLIPVYIIVGISVMNQNQAPGPHRTLGFLLALLGAILLLAGAFIIFAGPATISVYSSISSPYGFGNPKFGSYGYFVPTARSQRLVPENTAEFTIDPILVNVTETIAAATALRAEMLSATPTLTGVPFVIIITPTP